MKKNWASQRQHWLAWLVTIHDLIKRALKRQWFAYGNHLASSVVWLSENQIGAGISTLLDMTVSKGAGCMQSQYEYFIGLKIQFYSFMIHDTVLGNCLESALPPSLSPSKCPPSFSSPSPSLSFSLPFAFLPSHTQGQCPVVSINFSEHWLLCLLV